MQAYMAKSEVILQLSDLKEIIRKKYKADLKGVFGSYARNEQTSKSDVDILVHFDKGANLFDFVALGDFLEEKLHHKVDLVSDRALRPEIKDSVYTDLWAL